MAKVANSFLKLCYICNYSGLRSWSSPSLQVTSYMVMKRCQQEALSQASDEYLGEIPVIYIIDNMKSKKV